MQKYNKDGEAQRSDENSAETRSEGSESDEETHCVQKETHCVQKETRVSSWSSSYT